MPALGTVTPPVGEVCLLSQVQVSCSPASTSVPEYTLPRTLAENFSVLQRPAAYNTLYKSALKVCRGAQMCPCLHATGFIIGTAVQGALSAAFALELFNICH